MKAFLKELFQYNTPMNQEYKFRKSISIIMLILIASCGEENTYSKSIDLALRSDTLLLQNRLDEAESLINEAIKLEPKNHIAYNNLGVLKRKRGLSGKDVSESFLRSLSIRPDYETAIYNLADFYYNIEDYSNATIYCTKFLSLAKRGNESSNQLSRIYTIRSGSNNCTKQFSSALLDADSALMLDPDSHWAYKERASAYMGLHYFDEALENFITAIEIKPDYAPAYNGLGIYYDVGKKDLNKALRYYDKAISLDAKSATYLYNRGACLFDNGFREKALPDLRKADSLGKQEAKRYLQKY